MLGKMEALEQHIGRPVVWRHWSDESALNRWRASSGAIDQLIVHAASNGKIRLEGCPKEPNSVIKRMSLLKRLMIKNQFYVSAQCANLIDTFTNLRKNMKAGMAGVAVGDPLKHVLDALTYGLTMETWDEMQDQTRPEVGRLITVHRS
jgi:hypothetical protein